MDAAVEMPVLISQAINLFTLCLVQYSGGLLAVHKNVKVNYTRKLNHFLLFLIPILLGQTYVFNGSYGLFVLGAVLAVAKFIFYIEPIREKIPFIKMMFSSFDRPEDRPYTLLWLSTQTAAGYLVLLPMGILFAHYDLLSLMLIPIFIYGIGDGLAEPVGVKFGRHKYRVPALFTNKKFYRSLEGSACVFITSVIVIGAHYSYFTPIQFTVALGIVPLAMTLAEAVSPHTWDSPFMFFVGYLSLFIITHM